MTDKEEPLLASVRNWAEKTGLPLELYTKSVFGKEGFSVSHSTLYEDMQADKAREIDIVAYWRDTLGLVQIYFVIECKSSSKPWVVLTDKASFPRPLNYSFGLFSANVAEHIPIHLDLYRSDAGRMLEILHRSGYGLKVAHSGNDDPAFGAAMSALKAARAHVQNTAGKIDRFKFAIPVIVVDAPIVECNLSESGELEYRKVDYSEAHFNAYIPELQRASIRIVSKEALPFYASRFRMVAQAIVAQMTPQIAAFVRDMAQARTKPGPP
ncbi:hypothetical protein [Stenotrophomonas acidaminiphila]|uniref:hypothetical protein n=1 Tax=Stenotrophomonas acidaminiphila TaxID=128780 RepID=UPI00289C4F0F|nr:hypothetical protein [Stenotrophomonas acidaminiphila]